MTITELSEAVGRKESTLLKNFKQTKENLAKKGIIINKYGAGKTAVYTVEYINVEE